ncbi:PilC/PilY family type IV pilus protein [Pseudoxanthomonas sp. Root630]|uniref:PilC/PilY family type IV pilus protein n=1 Tax=Pseudoxanthomonas sp. Root630 TaxID=1736574 RepID=UPI000B315656|nr:PilC/PilY family type IV pilus protein [Pseudoxanthomonas sp. Root630]
MKTKKTMSSRKPSWLQTLAVTGFTALATLAGLPVHAATSFPDYPLLTGGNAIPPNIMLILDDSGSMERSWMWADTDTSSGTSDTVKDRSYVNNSLYYNPATTYLPWRTASMDLTDRLTAANFRSVSDSATSPTASPIDLTSSSNVGKTYFYVPRVANPGLTTSNYDKYRITSSSSSTSYGGGVVQKLAAVTLLGPTTIASIGNRNWSSCIVVNTNNATSVTIETSGGSGDGDLYVYTRRSDCSDNETSSTGNNNNESVTIDSPRATISFRIYAYTAVSNISYTVTAQTWSDMTPSGNTAVLQQAELQNFANWYQYHRTRNKMAKAGASEAFGRLGRNYRVGYDTIWNRNAGGATIGTAGSVPAYPIPWATNGGLFEGSNRTDFYSRLHGTGADDGTPLKGALQRAARYFATDNPWKVNSTGSMLTCRQNFAILTTDGYWNDNAGYTSVGNADAAASRDVDNNPPQYPDTYSDTLADVAYRYWSTDLRTGMANNVLTSAADPADWQHMVTFGVSIGLQGTLNPNLAPPTPWNVDPNTGGEGPKRIDDLWHAALNGRGKFVVASNSDRFAEALVSALSAIDSRSASGSNIASSSTKTDTSTLTFVAGFTSGTWNGDLVASPFNAALTGVSTTPDWILSQTFSAGQANTNYRNRTVLTMKGGTASLFNNTMTGASDLAARTGQADAATTDENIAYLRGDRTKEVGQTGGTLRRRTGLIGDIVNSSPAYSEDTKTVFIGANDGMLHAINADSASATRGQVLFSYVPKGLDYTALASLSATAYEHRYFVDGQIDVISRANQGNSKNILVAALGRGGRGVFALDVTAPAAMTTSKVLWDETTQGTTTEPNMGYVLGRVLIRKGNGDKTYAFVPNGIESPNGSATLFVYELNANGGITSTTRLVADASGGNGLMSLGMADLDGDNKVDTVYGGDLKGNIWRWDFTGNSPPSSAVRLFQAVDSANTAQPITGGLGVGRDNTGTIFVGFGTGRFISSTDMPGVATQTTQSLYGIKDQGSTIPNRASLQARSIPYSGTATRGFENYSALSAGRLGWYIDLPVPERVVSAPTIYGTAMYVSSIVPPTGSDCNSSIGSGFLNAINLFTGTSPESGSYFSNGGNVGQGIVGSIGITGGMPTEANVTSALATVGTGAFSTENGGEGNTSSQAITPPAGGRPARVNWRELVPAE